MGTCNFRMQKDFPLWAYDDSEIDEDEYYFLVEDVRRDLREESRNLVFFNLDIESGYYCGLQLVADLTNDADSAGFSGIGTEWGPDNESCNYWLGCCRSRALRKYRAEINKVNKILSRVGAAYGFEKYGCAGVFSNGEAVYYRIA